MRLVIAIIILSLQATFMAAGATFFCGDMICGSSGGGGSPITNYLTSDSGSILTSDDGTNSIVP